MNKGKLIIIAAPSGCGKGTVVKALMERNSNFRFSVSATTRNPREGEVDGKDYYFVTRERFMEMVDENAFLEHAIYAEACYGTPQNPVDTMLEKGHDVLLDIEVQGAFQVKEKRPDTLSIFLLPPSFEELENRLILRGKDSMEKIKKRLEIARTECELAPRFDYQVVNDDLALCVQQVAEIIENNK